MPIIDSHLHSNFSPDGYETPEAIVTAAIAKGFKQIAITDHCDLMHPEGYIGVDGSVLPAYCEKLQELKDKYRGKIHVCVGLEVGFQPCAAEATALLLKNAPLEYVINSVHCVAGTDCYAEGHFDGLDKYAAYMQYLDDVLASLDAPYNFHALGHLGYIERVSPYDNRHLSFDEFGAPLEAIFKKLIARGTVLELNTSLSKATGISVPDIDLVKIYYDMGGRLVTTSSDAHRTVRIGDGFERVIAELKRIGFTHLTSVRDGEQIQFKI